MKPSDGHGLGELVQAPDLVDHGLHGLELDLLADAVHDHERLRPLRGVCSYGYCLHVHRHRSKLRSRLNASPMSNRVPKMKRMSSLRSPRLASKPTCKGV